MKATQRYRPRGRRRPEEDTVFRARRRRRRLSQELAVRGSVALLLFLFNEATGIGRGGGADPLIRATTLLGLLLNVPYYLLAHSARWYRPQAYGRMLMDVLLLTVGLYAAGGLAAAPYLGVYALVPVYAGIVFSTKACLFATGAATLSFLALAWLQEYGWIPTTALPPPGAWEVAGFNLLVLNVVGGLTALLAEAYRQSRRRLATLYQDLERAHDESLRLNTEIQRGARLHVLGEVVAGVTHDIGNAIQPILLSLELLRQKAGDLPPETVRNIEQIHYGADTALRIVRNVLQTAHQASAEKVRISLPEIVRRTVELKGYDLQRDGIAVHLEFAPDFPRVVGAPFQLQQVLLNLVVNAQDALRDHRGTRAIALVGLTEPERAILEVRDTGPGIPADVLPRLFEAFFTTKAHGTGLGLAISADIVRGLGGELTAANWTGGGAVFRITLPAAPPRGVEAAPDGGGRAPVERRRPSGHEAPEVLQVVAHRDGDDRRDDGDQQVLRGAGLPVLDRVPEGEEHAEDDRRPDQDPVRDDQHGALQAAPLRSPSPRPGTAPTP